MYIDHIKKQHVFATNAAYLVHEFSRDVVLPPGYTFYLAAELKTLFDRVRKSRPGWKLKTNTGHVVTDGRGVRSVEVWSGDAVLGKIWLDHKYHDHVLKTEYCYTNERVDRSLARRRHKGTINIVLAARDIIKTFYEETVSERLKKVSNKARSLALESINDAERPFRVAYNAAVPDAVQFMFDNWDKFSEAHPRVAKDLPDLQLQYTTAMKARTQTVLYLHQLPSGEWVKGIAPTINEFPSFAEPSVTDPRTFLTEEQFVSLTMLRLQDTNRFVVGHGMKLDDTTFVLVS